MNNRLTSDSGNSVSLFPFLAVLLCTMGALLVLLVVLAERAGQRVVAEAKRQAVAPTSFQQSTGTETKEDAEFIRQLSEAQATLQQITKLRQQTEQQLQEEKRRLSHLEDHNRRLEDELQQLAIAAKQLEATEANQTVDQYQAERELVRLQQLVQEKTANLDVMRKQVQGKKSYAIVPFEGRNGTADPRIFLECCHDGLILQPEGIRFVSRDFSDKKSATNPLIKALSATQEHLRTQAHEAGESNPPTAIALFLVRSDGEDIFYEALRSFKISGEPFGVDYLNAEGELNFPTSPDLILARKQQRAVFHARALLEQNIKDQPRRFREEQVRVASLTDAMIKQLRRKGDSEGARAKTPNGYGQTSSDQNQKESIPASELGNQMHRQFGNSTEGLEFGVLPGVGNSDGQAPDFTDDTSSSKGQAQETGQGESHGVPGGTSSHGSTGMAQQQGAGGTGANAAGSDFIQETDQPSRKDWALKHDRSRSSVPLQRPIQVEVSQSQLTFLPSRDSEVSRREISMLQPTPSIAREFVESLQERADEWGIAGIDLHWKPVLYLHVGPDATETAVRLVQLLSNSGVEVRISENNRFSRRGPEHATR